MSNLFENEVLETDDGSVAIVYEPSVSVERKPDALNEALHNAGNTLVDQFVTAETIGFDRETGEVIEAPKPAGKRVKRTEAQMVAALGGSSLKEATYVLDRVAKLEEKISDLLASISPKGRDLVFEERPDLAKF